MSCFLFENDEEQMGKINIDDLYENKHKKDLKQLSIFNKILNRIHKRIEYTGKNKKKETHIWFTVPEYIFGEPLYNKGEIIGYLVSKLIDNGFFVKYVHPNTLFVSWHNWVPSYVRSEFQKKTGLVIDEKGIIIKKDEDNDDDNNNNNNKLINDKSSNGKPQKQYTPIGQYKPTGNFVYTPEIFEKIEKRIS